MRSFFRENQLCSSKNEDSNNKKRKRGAEKLREREKILIQSQASSCRKITSFTIGQTKVIFEETPDLQICKDRNSSFNVQSDLKAKSKSFGIENNTSTSKVHYEKKLSSLT